MQNLIIHRSPKQLRKYIIERWLGINQRVSRVYYVCVCSCVYTYVWAFTCTYVYVYVHVKAIVDIKCFPY